MKEVFLALVRLGIGNAATIQLPNHIDWDAVESLAERQGVLGVVYDGVLKHTVIAENTEIIPLTVKLRWLGKVMQGYEQWFLAYRKAIADLAAFYSTHGYRMMLLKGLACGMNWPKPEHRPCGDIDIWLFGQQKEADDEMARELGIKIDESHHHHTVFQWEGFSVENHYDFVNIYHHKSNVDIEKIFKELGTDNSNTIELGAEKVYLPSPNLHALFLIKHLVSHFASEQITIRQLLDWAFFVEKHWAEVDWEWLKSLLVQFHMDEFENCINLICVEDLGFNRHIFSGLSGTEVGLKERILYDILKPEFSEQEPHQLWKRILFKYRRWKANEWKHKLCYNESMQSSFWSGVKNHMLKPAQI